MARVLAAALGLAVASPGPALAAPPNAGYGGGALTPAAPLVGLRVSSTGLALAFEAEAIARCTGQGPVDERLTARPAVAADGSFTGTATRTYRLNPSETRVVFLGVRGRIIDGGSAAGALRLVVTVRRAHRAPVRCLSGIQHWEARSAPGIDPSPGLPVAGAAYYGTTNQPGRYVPFPLAFRVSGDGSRVESTVFRLYRRCTGAASADVPNDMPSTAVEPGGTFSVAQRYRQRFSDSTEDFTFRLTGRFAPGAAGGTLRGTSIVRDLRTARIIGRCDSGPVLWAAAP